MSVFNRIAGTEEPKVPVWPVMSDAIRVLDGGLQFSAFAEKYELSPAEQQKASAYLNAIGSRILSLAATMTKVAMIDHRATLQAGDPLRLTAQEVTAAMATIELAARSIVRSQLEDYLLSGEHQVINEAGFESLLGL